MHHLGVGLSPLGSRRARRVLSGSVAGLVALSGLVITGALHARASSPYAAAVAADSPTLYYRLGETSGTAAADSSGNGHTGTYAGDPTLGVSGATNDGDTAVAFSQNTSDYLDSNYTPGSDPALTIETWAYVPGAFPNGYQGSIANTSYSNSNGSGFVWFFNADNTSYLRVATSNTTLTSQSLPALSAQRWHHLAFTYDGAALCGYVDGVQQFCQALTGSVPPDNGDTIRVAAPDKSGSYGVGLHLDEFAYYTHALTAARVLAHYNARTPLITGISPTHGQASGGTSVVITGVGLTGATAVTFGGTAASSYTVNSDTQVTATAPAASALGAVDIRATTPGGQTAATAADQYTYDRVATTTATPASTANPSSYGQAVTFSTSVSGAAPTSTGTITWMDGSTNLGSTALDGSGNATFTTGALATGPHTISAVYGGDTFHLGSTSSNLNQGVNLATPSVSTPTSTVNPSTYGQSVKFTVTVSGPGATPTGNVTWFDGATSLTTTALAGGTTSLTTAALAGGGHSITARYNGDGSYNSATSAALTQTVNQSSTATALGAAPNPSTAGQTVTYSATVTAVAPGAGIPTGFVTFYDGATTLGSTSLDAGGSTSLSVAEPGGSHSITAQYGGDANFTTSTSAVVTQTVNTVGSAVSAPTSSANPSTYGSPVTFTVTVTGPPLTPTGTVTFYDGAVSIGTATLDGSGTATFTTSLLPGGSRTITATYNGDRNHGTSTSATFQETVNKATPTAQAPTSSSNPSTYGGSVTFSTVVTGPGATPTGTVTWMDGATALGSSSLDVSGNASFTTATLGAGAHSIGAVYGGDGNYTSASSPTTSDTVNKATPAVQKPATSVNPSTYGGSVTLSTSVSGAGATPTGTVTWMDGATNLGTSSLDPSGATSFSITSLSAGSHTISAVYGGNADYKTATSPTLTQTVNKATPTVQKPVSSANPSTYGSSVMFSTSVSGPGATPAGTVTWMDGATTLGTSSLDPSGATSFSIASLLAGPHTISAVYGGNADYTAATSPTLAQAVGRATPTVQTPASSSNPSTYASSVTFSTTVSGPGVTPTGTITWMDGLAPLGTSSLDAGGNASFTMAGLIGGTHSITASYGGDANYAAATSAGLSQTISKATPAAAAPTSSSNPSTYGGSVTFATTVSGPGVAPTGSVTWMDGATTLGSSSLDVSGKASFSTATLGAGPHTIGAVYGGDGNYTSASSPTTSDTVNKATPTVQKPASSVNPSTYGGSVTLSTSVSGAGATPTGTVTWMDGATNLGTSTLDPSGKASFTSATLGAGSHTISAVYGGNANYKTATSPTLTQAVNKATPTVQKPVSSTNPSTYGGSVTFSTRVSGPGATPAGTVTWMDGATTLGTSSLDPSGATSLSIASLTAGAHSISAVYGGNANYITATSTSLADSVSRASTQASTPSSSANPAQDGQPVTFSISLANAGAATGTVTWMDGSKVLGTSSVSAGSTSFTTASLTPGSHQITATYAGDGNYQGAASAALTETVLFQVFVAPAGPPAPAPSASPAIPPVVPPPTVPPVPSPSGAATRPIVSGPIPTGADKPPATGFAAFVASIANVAVKSAFPLLLLLLAIIFLILQDRIDRKDPKLALAPTRPDPQLTFPSPRGIE